MRSNAEKQKNQNVKRVLIALALAAAILFSMTGIVWFRMFQYTNPLSEYGLPYQFAQNGTLPEDVTVDGQTYIYNEDIIAVLFIGYDETEQREQQGIGYQADTLLLAAVNKKTGAVTIISIPRDTAADIAVFDVNGNYATTQTGQIALSRAYGRELPISNDLTMAAVSNLLYQIPICRYFAMNIDGIGAVTDAVGGVELPLIADFTMFNPEMKMGTYYMLSGAEAELYVRSRQIPGMSGEDTDRMKRQTQFVTEFIRTLKTAAGEEPGVLIELLKTMRGYSQTNLSTVEILYLAVKLRNADISADSIITMPGRTTTMKQVAEQVYAVDEEALKRLVLDTFFVAE